VKLEAYNSVVGGRGGVMEEPEWPRLCILACEEYDFPPKDAMMETSKWTRLCYVEGRGIAEVGEVQGLVDMLRDQAGAGLQKSSPKTLVAIAAR
jgi:hypothetical protein